MKDVCTVLRNLGMALPVALTVLPAVAQDMRDPTVPPPDKGSGVAAASPMGVEGMTVLVRDGKPYLVVGTRLYATGESVGSLRVDRITETEVWLRDATKLIKVPRFAGIERKTLPMDPQCKGNTLTPESPSAPAPCEDTPP